jgi:hypothetical protein
MLKTTKIMIMKSKIYSTGFAVLLMAVSCTNLDETLYDTIETKDFGKNPVEVERMVGAAYSYLRGFQDEDGLNCFPTSELVYFLNLTTSDEACIPTRGTDWFDGGRYQRAQRHEWRTTDAPILSAWKYAYHGITRINAIMFEVSLTELEESTKQTIYSELRGLRAYYYYLLLDWFGNVPIITEFGQENVPNSSRLEVFEFVESELLDVKGDLYDGVAYGRFSQNVAHTLLARLYVNAEVFTGTQRWQDCIDMCERVVGYSLEPNYFTSFLTENQVSNEIIFAIPYDHNEQTVGNFMNSMSLHYNQNQAYPGPFQWSANGMSAQPGVYSKFDENDVRRNAMKEGPQFIYGTSNLIQTPDGDLVYTEAIENFENAKQYEGVRLYKYEVRDDEQWERDHDFVVMRYAEVLMMQAECYVRLGYPESARPFITQVRERAGLGVPQDITLEFLDDEYLKEFLFEGIRRNVNIRFGTWFEPWWEKGSTPQYRGVFPIPQAELELNPNLTQNPEY